LYPKENIIYTQLALFLIGKTYFDGTFVKRNKTKGLNYYEQAAKVGNINAAYTLSSIYDVKEVYDKKKKIFYLKQCAKAGLSIAHAALANLALEENNGKLFLMHFKEAMKDDKKLINTLELTTIARDTLNQSLSEYRKNLKKIWKKSLKETSSKSS
jgi:TPR repeat protein